MELLLWRWSTAVQLSSLVTIAVFFFALSRSVRLDEVRSWARAWACNLAATGGGPHVLFSVGMATLPPGGHPDDALRAADESMYAAKAARPARKAIGRRA